MSLKLPCKISEIAVQVDMVLNRYLDVLKPMHEQFIEPTKKYADIIIPQGGENLKGIGILCKYIEGLTI